jgi:hypothetical protein
MMIIYTKKFTRLHCKVLLLMWASSAALTFTVTARNVRSGPDASGQVLRATIGTLATPTTGAA